MSDSETEPCNCGEYYCTGFRPKGERRRIVPQHIEGEGVCGEEIARLKRQLQDERDLHRGSIDAMVRAQEECDRLRATVRELLDALPRCGAIVGYKADAHGEPGDEIECTRAATKQGECPGDVYCDECGPLCEDWREQPDLPCATAVRAARKECGL